MQILTAPSLKDCVRSYPGCRISFRLTSKETSDALSVMEIQMTPGAEPPRHYHLWEDETIFLHNGTITFFVGDDIINAKAGDIVFMPRQVPHHFVVTSPRAYATLVATPGGMEHFFEEITVPFDQQSIPAAEKPSAEEGRRLFAAAEKFGMKFV